MVKFEPINISISYRRYSDILQPLFKKFSIKPTYFLSPEVIKDFDCIEVLKSVDKYCELGTHLHADYIEPQKTFKDFSGKETHSFQTDFPAEIEFEKLKNLTNDFYSAFNYYQKFLEQEDMQPMKILLSP